MLDMKSQGTNAIKYGDPRQDRGVVHGAIVEVCSLEVFLHPTLLPDKQVMAAARSAFYQPRLVS